MTEKLPKSDAALAVRGFGLVPVARRTRVSLGRRTPKAIEDGEALGSACSLNFPPGSKLSESPEASVGAQVPWIRNFYGRSRPFQPPAIGLPCPGSM